LPRLPSWTGIVQLKQLTFCEMFLLRPLLSDQLLIQLNPVCRHLLNCSQKQNLNCALCFGLRRLVYKASITGKRCQHHPPAKFKDHDIRLASSMVIGSLDLEKGKKKVCSGTGEGGGVQFSASIVKKYKMYSLQKSQSH